MDAIIVENLSKSFKSSKRKKFKNNSENKNNFKIKNNLIKAANDISFKVKEGEIFGLLGPNGAGKTTTIRMMTGVLQPTLGNISIYGYDLWKYSISCKQIMGNVPEMADAYLDLTGFQNLIYIGEIYNISKKERTRKANYLLKKFELYEKKDIKTKKYSKGMNQRLLLCMALMNNPKILFLDEPTSGLDVQSARIIKELIKDYNKQGMTIFLTTHDMEVANELCNRIAIINQGKIINLDTPENLRNLTQKFQAIDCYLEEIVDIKEITSLKAIKDVEFINNRYHIIVDDVNDAIYELIAYFKSKNVKLKQFNTYQPKLEDAFLEIISEEGGLY
ncbi:MAG: ATP-binding cassette domain-containing protein [Candidatus Lokiarchaeota archaeon]|nr:ATP-binding cassette domain-containing protein [Candidatus Lokiarchaeota archaeon]